MGILAGGYQAMFRAVEGAEDDFGLGEEDLKKVSFTEIIKEINKEHGTTIIVYNTVFLMDFQNRELFMAST
jgi:hypothetical protein